MLALALKDEDAPEECACKEFEVWGKGREMMGHTHFSGSRREGGK